MDTLEPAKVKGIVVIKVAVGLLPKSQAAEYIADLRMKFTKSDRPLPTDVSLLFIPIYGGGKDTEVQYISFDGTDFTTENIEELITGNKEQLINVRLTKLEKAKMTEKAKRAGFKTLSEYLRVVGLNSTLTVS